MLGARDGIQEPMKKEQCQQQAEEEQCQQQARIQRELSRRTSTHRTTAVIKVMMDLVSTATQSGRRGDNDDEVINTISNVNTKHPVDGQETVSTNNKIEMVEVLHCNAGDARHRHGRVEEVFLAGKEMTHNLEMNFEKMTAFVKENTAKEL